MMHRIEEVEHHTVVRTPVAEEAHYAIARLGTADPDSTTWFEVIASVEEWRASNMRVLRNVDGMARVVWEAG